MSILQLFCQPCPWLLYSKYLQMRAWNLGGFLHIPMPVMPARICLNWSFPVRAGSNLLWGWKLWGKQFSMFSLLIKPISNSQPYHLHWKFFFLWNRLYSLFFSPTVQRIGLPWNMPNLQKLHRKWLHNVSSRLLPLCSYTLGWKLNIFESLPKFLPNSNLPRASKFYPQ